jgi:DnaK suppressor protein
MAKKSQERREKSKPEVVRQALEPARPHPTQLEVPEKYRGIYDILIKRRDALRRALGPDLSSLLTNAAEMGDAGVSGADDIESRLIEVETRELARIQDAIERMREGAYGVCMECEKKIPKPRLEALPYAVRCIPCQRTYERVGGDEQIDVPALLSRMEEETDVA